MSIFIKTFGMKYLACVAIVLSLNGCSGCCHYDKCADQPLHVRLSGFDSLDIRQVVLYRFTKGSHFSQLSDSAVYDLTQGGAYSADTSVALDGFNTENDFRISVPASGKHYDIDSISYEALSQKVCNGIFSLDKMPVCYAVASGYRIDGVHYVGGDTSQPRIHK